MLAINIYTTSLLGKIIKETDIADNLLLQGKIIKETDIADNLLLQNHHLIKKQINWY